MANGKPGRPRKNPLPVQTVEAAEALGVSPVTIPLEDQDEAVVREKAVNVYRIPLSGSETKQQIIDAIRRRNSSGQNVDFALDGRNVDKIPAGWSKINLYKESIPGSQNYPLPVGCNGYICGIPRGVDVLVPNKIVGVLQDSVERRWVEDKTAVAQGQRVRFMPTEVHVNPFTILGSTPGPDPRPNTTKAFRYGPRKMFRDVYGFWPSAAALKEAIKDGTVSLLAVAK